LLEEPVFSPSAIRGKRVTIFRGRGGLPLLGDALAARGARVDYVEVYERRRPLQQPEAASVFADDGRTRIVVIGSRDGLANLFAMVDDACRTRIRDLQFLVVSDRLARACSEFGVRVPPLRARGAADRLLLEALLDYKAMKDQ
jgi:uroporphyrinogen-III synthase